ncbi:MAG: hypothetical protein M1579_04800 [Gammaproteobacteria bacterium]|nr:hypothetical protein [Gammaproteobacteria bacterium]
MSASATMLASIFFAIITLAILTKNKFKKHEHKRFCVTLTPDQVEVLQAVAKEKNNNASPEDTLKLLVDTVLLGFSHYYHDVEAAKKSQELKDTE